MPLTFAHWGNYTPCFKTLFENLGFEVIPPQKTNQEAIKEGVKLSPELYCFPLKVNVGNYLTGLRKGADTILMWEAVHGNCRFRYYWVVQQKILREAGFKVRVINLNAKNFVPQIKRIKKENNISWRRIGSAFYLAFQELRFVESLEKKADYLRPREKTEGETDEVLDAILEQLNEIENLNDFKQVKKNASAKLSEIETTENEIPKARIIGEIYTVVDNAINFDLEKKLGKMGVEVHRDLNISYFVKHGIFPWLDYVMQKKVNPYLKHTVGGHGRDAVKEMLDSTQENYDGVVHLLPFGCFVKDTNITVEGYLQKPIQDIRKGEKVLTHKGRFKKVTQTFCRDYQGELFKVDCGGKLNLKVTPEHPVLLAKAFTKNHNKKFKDLKFTPIAEAKKGDFIAIPISQQVKNKDHFKLKKDYKRKPKWEDIKEFPYSLDLMRILGYWLAEGTIRYDGGTGKKYKRGIGFHFASKEKDYINDVKEIIDENFEAKISPYYRSDRPSSMELYIGNRNLGEIVYTLCGEHCDQKVLHQELTELKPELQREILKGFFRGDGYFRDKYGETTYRGITTSWDLASQLFWFLIRNRIRTSLMEQNIKNRKPSYVLKISNAKGIKRMNDEMIEVTDREDNVRFRELDDYFLVPIREIETTEFKGKVYNLEVEEDHSYVANFLAVHNCMPEVTVRPILQEIHQETGLPFLSLSLDEEVGEAGIQTRLEAFVDVLRNYYQKRL